jgi:predicted peroxiredoxin
MIRAPCARLVWHAERHHHLLAGALRVLRTGRTQFPMFTDEGVGLALRGYVAPIRAELDPPVKRVHDQFIDKGGRFYVCPICFNDRGLDEGELAENAELKRATP